MFDVDKNGVPLIHISQLFKGLLLCSTLTSHTYFYMFLPRCFFFPWVFDMLCQFSCLTNCAYGFGILLVFYKFNRKKPQPQTATTTLSCEAITLKWVIKLIPVLNVSCATLQGFFSLLLCRSLSGFLHSNAGSLHKILTRLCGLGLHRSLCASLRPVVCLHRYEVL